ncbi:conjugal transfer protein TraG [Bacillus thuringiensis]|uniref:type IV secretory system conjugative DNA transfer family protein n=1 Tax=Bacillus thuringiensis TaxID=1428 RepID=UPI000BFD3557|nr:TraM recognition domain-containing protein [Bacillus thuringiensis]PGP44792.1 conjugal transfer protein TraG [Bacillus thuringiensis]
MENAVQKNTELNNAPGNGEDPKAGKSKKNSYTVTIDISKSWKCRLAARSSYYVVTLLLLLAWYFAFRGIYKYASFWSIQMGASLPTLSIFGNPFETNYYIETFFSFWILIYTWQLSTKVKTYQEIKRRWFIFSMMLIGIVAQYLWAFSVPLAKIFIPFLNSKAGEVSLNDKGLEDTILSNFSNIMHLVFAIPVIIIILVLLWLFKIFFEHKKELLDEFGKWEYVFKIPGWMLSFLNDDRQRKLATSLHKFFTEKNPSKLPEPDIFLGPNSATREMAVIQGKSLTLNIMIIGNIGTGKSAALGLPIANQILDYMASMINNFKTLYARKDYHSEDVKGTQVNGLTVIEPSNDFCEKVYKLVLAHKIPESVIFYLDPTNPDTPSINFVRGPVDKVAEMLCSVLTGLSDNGAGNPFFVQSERSHLKQHIYLLKLHDSKFEARFEHLIDLYNDANLVFEMHLKLKERLPNDIESIPDRDERNHWRIMKQVDEWFDLNYVPEISGGRGGGEVVYHTEGKYYGQPKIIDKQETFVRGLRNTLNDISAQPLLRRVLCGPSDFDFEKHLEFGGILLINTAKGELSDLSDVFGKLCLYAVQNAVFRRKPNVSPYHPVLVDEFADYIYKAFKSFPAQSRKYKAPLIVIAQTISQLAIEHGPRFMDILLGTFRNKLVYGDVTNEDAKLFSKLMGTKTIYEAREGDQEIDMVTAETKTQSTRRTSYSYSKTEVPILSENDILIQKAFQCAAKIVKDNAPQGGIQVNANFVPATEFKTAKIQVDAEAAVYWLKIREESLNAEIKYDDYVTDTDVDSEETVIEELSMPKTAPTAIEGWLQTVNPDTYDFYNNDDYTDSEGELTNNQSVQDYSRNSAPKLKKGDATASIATSTSTEPAKINEGINVQKENVPDTSKHREPIEINKKASVITETPIEVPRAKHTPQYREPAYTSTVTHNQQEQEIQRTAKINGKNTTSNLTMQWLQQQMAATVSQDDKNTLPIDEMQGGSRLHNRKVAEVTPESAAIKAKLNQYIEGDIYHE